MNKENPEDVQKFISAHRRLVNALIVLANVFSPTEENVTDFALIRDHVLLPIYGQKEESSTHYTLQSRETVPFKVDKHFVNHD